MSRRAQAALGLLLSALPLAGCGRDADARLLYDRAHEALAAGQLNEADAAAEKAAARGDPGTAMLAGFLRGNIAFAYCGLAERQAGTAAAEPFAFDVAIAYAEKARRFWQLAAMSRADWPAARRNVERALLKLEELKRRKTEFEEQRRRAADPRPQPKPQPRPEPLPGTGPEEVEQDPADLAQLSELSPEQVRRLLETLAEKEREKTALRRAEREKRTAGVERDW